MKTTKLDRDRMRGIRSADASFLVVLDDLDTLLARCARQEELLERAKVMIEVHAGTVTATSAEIRMMLYELEEIRKK